MFTLENVFEKRKKFKKDCKKAKACKEEFPKLLKAETESDFMQVIYKNFNWVYNQVTQFGLKYDAVENFNEGFAGVRIDNKLGFIDTKFKEICDVKYDNAFPFFGGFARVKIGDKWGHLNSKGKEICEIKYDYAYSFNEGFAGVQIGNKWGYLNSKGKEICDVKFDNVGYFFEGFARVQIADKWGILDGDGKEVYEVKYTLPEVTEILKELIKCSQ